MTATIITTLIFIVLLLSCLFFSQ
uniref:Uncharacterized protein n=1 Tax=Rhizophora mucronata TaxID=61149 RepID=A0A2P2QKH8_RHIMU